MAKDLKLAMIILLISGGIAGGVNEWRKDGRQLTWIRQEVPLTHAQSRPAVAAASTAKVEAAAHPSDGAADQAADPAQPAGIQVIEIDSVLKHLEDGDAAFIDARGESDFDEGHLRHALHVPSDDVYNQMDNVISMIGPQQKVIVYCGGGECEASHKVAQVLLEYNFVDVSVYLKGWEEVTQSGRFQDMIVTGKQP